MTHELLQQIPVDLLIRDPRNRRHYLARRDEDLATGEWSIVFHARPAVDGAWLVEVTEYSRYHDDPAEHYHLPGEALPPRRDWLVAERRLTRRFATEYKARCAAYDGGLIQELHQLPFGAGLEGRIGNQN